MAQQHCLDTFRMPLSALSLPDADRRKVVDALIKSSSGAAFSPNELASSASIRSSTSRFSHMWRPMSLCVFPYVSGLILLYTALATSASWCARSSSPWAVHPYSSSMASTSGPLAAGPLQYSTSSSHSSSVCKRKTHFSHMWRPLSLCVFPYSQHLIQSNISLWARYAPASQSRRVAPADTLRARALQVL